jgi:hypothetical protein
MAPLIAMVYGELDIIMNCTNRMINPTLSGEGRKTKKAVTSVENK